MHVIRSRRRLFANLNDRRKAQLPQVNHADSLSALYTAPGRALAKITQLLLPDLTLCCQGGVRCLSEQNKLSATGLVLALVLPRPASCQGSGQGHALLLLGMGRRMQCH
jgi:hypothetical protein